MPRRLVILGFGRLGRTVLSLLCAGGAAEPGRILVLDRAEPALAAARGFGAEARQTTVDRDSLARVFDTHLRPDDLLLNLAPGVATAACIDYCYARAILYLDAALALWAGDARAPGIAPAARTAFAARDALLAYGRRHPGGPTALVAHGADPGLSTHVVRHALGALAARADAEALALAEREAWGPLARRCGVRVIQLVMRDHQTAPTARPPGALRTPVSAAAFAECAVQPAELAWGTHEQHWPADGVDFGFGAGAAIHLARAAGETVVRTWTPDAGPCHGLLWPSPATSALGELLTVRDAGRTVYRPTVMHVLRPGDDGWLGLAEWRERGFRPGPTLAAPPEAPEGPVECGVLLGGMRDGAQWCGWRLEAAEARRHGDAADGITLPAAAALVAAMAWMERSPNAGVIEPQALPAAEILAACQTRLGRFESRRADWTPAPESATLFPAASAPADPWQFANLRVAG